MKFIEKFYAEDKFRSSPLGKWCPYQLGYEPGPDPERKNAGKCPEVVKDYSCATCWNREIPEEKETTESKENTPSNPFPGFEINDVMQLRNGKLCIVLPNNASENNKSLFYKYDIREAGYGSGLSCVSHCCDYTDNIYNNKSYNYDVVKLWRSDSENALMTIGYFFNKESNLKTIKPIWQEQPTKKMTLKEIEQKLGYSVEIVEESEKEDEDE